MRKKGGDKERGKLIIHSACRKGVKSNMNLELRHWHQACIYSRRYC